MAALTPIDHAVAEGLTAEVREEFGDPHAVTVSNFNSPTQCVVAGERRAVERVMDRAQDEHWAAGHVIEHRVPMHTPMFGAVVPHFRPALEGIAWRAPSAEYWPNVDAAAIAEATATEIVDRLARHVCEPVRWRQTIDAALARHGDPIFVEVGPLQVLTRLMNRRWIGPASAFALDLMDGASHGAFTARLREIRDAAA
jgi:malonyl CoA-acyl carrier protein transacylase